MTVDEPFKIAFPRDLAGDLRERMASGSWKMLREQEVDPRRKGDAETKRSNLELVRALPSARHVTQLLDVAYVASLMEEEGRSVRCAFGYLSAEGAGSLGFGTYRFASPEAFTPSKVAKLAPVAQPGRTELGVWAQDGTLFIWGLIHHGDQTFAIDLEHKPTYFSARILRAGTFTVHFDQRLQLLFARDHGAFFDYGLDLQGTMRDRAGLAPLVATALARLAARMLLLGHGGTILVVDKDLPRIGLIAHPSLAPTDGIDTLLADAVAMDEQVVAGSLKQEGESPEQYTRRGMQIEKAHDQALDFVAHLTAVDGAVVLDDELGLLGAGFTIQTPDHAAPAEVVLEDPRQMGVERRVLLSSLGGNRHRSAVSFCSQQKGLALALVASQDGNLSFFARRDDGLVHALRPYELGVGL